MKILGFIIMLLSIIAVVLSFIGFVGWWVIGIITAVYCLMSGVGLLFSILYGISSAAIAVMVGFVGMGLSTLLGVFGYYVVK